MNNRNRGYDIGDVARITLSTLDDDLEPAAPDALTITIKPPGASAVTYTFGTDEEVSETSPGHFVCYYPITESGLYLYRWTGTGDNAGVEQGSFTVRPNTF